MKKLITTLTICLAAGTMAHALTEDEKAFVQDSRNIDTAQFLAGWMTGDQSAYSQSLLCLNAESYLLRRLATEDLGLPQNVSRIFMELQRMLVDQGIKLNPALVFNEKHRKKNEVAAIEELFYQGKYNEAMSQLQVLEEHSRGDKRLQAKLAKMVIALADPASDQKAIAGERDGIVMNALKSWKKKPEATKAKFIRKKILSNATSSVVFAIGSVLSGDFNSARVVLDGNYAFRKSALARYFRNSGLLER